jgi:sugar/nucleoside kinase (ribokinase family)
MSFLVVGSLAYDSVKTPAGERKDVLGGSALYCALAARFFTPVNLVAAVGEDFQKNHLDLLKKKKIDTKGLEIKKGKTFRWRAEYSHHLDDRRTLSTELNVLKGFDPRLPAEYRRSKYLFLANLDPEVQLKVIRQVKNAKLIASDTMNLWIRTKREILEKLLKKIEIFIINDTEARELTRESNLIRAARLVEKMGPKIIIIKKGEHGALFWSKNIKFFSTAYPVESVCDPTGSGDVFAGAFMGYLAKKNKISEPTFKKAVVYGNIIASFNVESFSINRLADLSLKEINNRYREFKRLTSF